jgi:beta-lactam-binding protein with PASTA domain
MWYTWMLNDQSDLVDIAHFTVVTVPNLLGRSEADATTAIVGSGFAVGAISHHDDCNSAGDVETQDPIGGARVLPGSTVTFTVSTCTGGGGGGGGGGPILPK